MSFCEFLDLLLGMAYAMVVLSPAGLAVGLPLGWLLSGRGWEVSKEILFWCVIVFSVACFACLTWATQPPFERPVHRRVCRGAPPPYGDALRGVLRSTTAPPPPPSRNHHGCWGAHDPFTRAEAS